MPVWLRNVLALFLILAFSASFYYFFIRPYAYRWKPCGGQKNTAFACLAAMMFTA